MANRERLYTSRRRAIVDAIVDKLKDIDGSGEYLTSVYGNVFPTVRYWDEITDFPAIHINTGLETREYQTAKYKDRFLTVTITCYVQDDRDSGEELDKLIEDVETVLEENARLKYYDRRGACQMTKELTILSIDTDEGVLDPIAVAEIVIQIQY